MSDQKIKVYTAYNRVITDVSFAGSDTPVPVLLDTGSSELAVVPGTNIGSAQATQYYAGCAYGNGTYGWVGQWYESSTTFGDSKGEMTDERPMLVALMSDENAHLATSYMKGIMGIDFGGNELYRLPQKIGQWGRPVGVTQEGTFAATMLNEGDDFTMAFVGLTWQNSGDAFVAFGATANDMLGNDKLIGSTSIVKSNPVWYTLNTPMGVKFKNTPNPIADTVYNSPGANTDPIIDSGTPTLVLPQAVSNAMDAAGYDLRTLPQDTVIVIDLPGGLELNIPVSELGDLTMNVQFGQQPILGFPLFCIFDIKFETDTETLSFYSRQ